MNKKAFTVMEVCIAAGILTVFIGGLLALFTSGNKMGNSTIWLQSTTNQLKNATRQLNTSIRKSSYPSKLEFPGKNTICDNVSFKLHFADRVICATETIDFSDNVNGTEVLKLTESTPAKSGFDSDDQDANLTYHIYYLAKNGNLSYSRFEEKIDAGSVSEGLSKTIPGSAPRKYNTILTRNVESVYCCKTESTDGTTSGNDQQSLKIVINCRIPHGETTRSETTVATPNVEMIGDL